MPLRCTRALRRRNRRTHIGTTMPATNLDRIIELIGAFLSAVGGGAMFYLALYASNSSVAGVAFVMCCILMATAVFLLGGDE